MSNVERSGFRHIELSARHRLWGLECPMTDVDWLVIEWARCVPLAMFEFKLEHAAVVDWSKDKNLQMLGNFCMRQQLPFFGCRYAQNLSWFRVAPLNQAARRQLGANIAQDFNEEGYVRLLYEGIRGIRVPRELQFENGKLVLDVEQLPLFALNGAHERPPALRR